MSSRLYFYHFETNPPTQLQSQSQSPDSSLNSYFQRNDKRFDFCLTAAPTQSTGVGFWGMEWGDCRWLLSDTTHGVVGFGLHYLEFCFIYIVPVGQASICIAYFSFCRRNLCVFLWHLHLQLLAISFPACRFVT